MPERISFEFRVSSFELKKIEEYKAENHNQQIQISVGFYFFSGTRDPELETRNFFNLFDLNQGRPCFFGIKHGQKIMKGEAAMKSSRKIISIDEEKCTGCGLCVPSCAEGAIEIIDGKARLVSDRYCDGLGACLGECPAGALKIIEAEADAFDEKAVREHLTVRDRKPEPPEQPTMACGCPSAMIRTFRPASQKSVRVREGNEPAQESALTHWPVQIRLVPPTAPFLKGAELLVAADCTPLAYPDFHRDLLKGKVVLLGCPKFDDTEAYVQKFRGIFEKSDIRRITAVVMEVPCCRGLPVILQKAMALAGKHIPLDTVVISTEGKKMN